MKDHYYKYIKKYLEDVVCIHERIMQNLQYPDMEDFYELQVPIVGLSAVVRQLLEYKKKEKDFRINVFLKKEGVRFFEKKWEDRKFSCSNYEFVHENKTIKPLHFICSQIIHKKQSEFTDSRKSDNKQRDKDILIYFVATDKVCRSCKEVNGVEDAYMKNTSFVKLDDCSCGVFIDLGSFLKQIQIFTDSLK